MIIHCFCGKGGVGKTFSAVALGRHFATKGEKVGIIDYDGGHSVHRELGDHVARDVNKFIYCGQNLYTAVVQETPFLSITQFNKGQVNVYLEQFPGHQGLVPFADMIMSFFGAPTDPVGLQKFVRLVELIVYAHQNEYKRLIIDIEPTAGFQTMIRSAEALTRSIVNLGRSGRLKLVSLGVKWPDIRAFLSGPYMKQADKYAGEIQRTVNLLTQARFVLVCVPKVSPVLQTGEIQRIIKGFNGKIAGCVINNSTKASYEDANIAKLDDRLRKVRIPLYADLEGSGPKRRSEILHEVGMKIAEGLDL